MSGPNPGQELKARLSEGAIKPIEIARFLDALQPSERVDAIRSVGRKEQRALYQAVDRFAPVRLVELVGPGTPDGGTVRHYGKNTLPAFSEFEKRFTRPAGQNASMPTELHGFNFGTMAPITGPGYFVAVEDADREEVLVDYRRVPTTHPAGWPDIKPNDKGLSRFVYGFMVDTLRRVSEHVTIGSAARNGKDMGSWFLLCREP